jgi:hypothetical protein
MAFFHPYTNFEEKEGKRYYTGKRWKVQGI